VKKKNEIIETLLTMSFDWNQNIYLTTYYKVQIYVTHIYKLFCIYFGRKETDFESTNNKPSMIIVYGRMSPTRSF
jgi:hypothetical protein